MSDALVENLLDLDGVESVHIEKTINVTHKKTATGEIDESFNEVREQVVSEGKFQSLANGFGWDYYGTVDVIGDYHLKDRFAQRKRVDADNEEDNK